jgi:hypothetical protein
MPDAIEPVLVPKDALLAVIHHLYEEGERRKLDPAIGEAVDALFAAYQMAERRTRPAIDMDAIPF